MFPKAKRAKVDTDALGAQMANRKAELQEDLGVADEQSALTAAQRKPRNVEAKT
jgi:hypothetical protein